MHEAEIDLPLSDRVLRRLGRPRMVWIVAWSLVPLVQGLLFTTTIRLTVRPFDERLATDALVTQAVLAYVVFVLLIGTRFLASKARVVAGSVGVLLPRPVTPPLFGRIGAPAVRWRSPRSPWPPSRPEESCDMDCCRPSWPCHC